MKLSICAILDTVSGVFGTPFFVRHRGEAVRHLKTLVLDYQSAISRSPGDYKVYHLGVFDDGTGELSAEKPVELGHAIALRDEYDKERQAKYELERQQAVMLKRGA